MSTGQGHKNAADPERGSEESAGVQPSVPELGSETVSDAHPALQLASVGPTATSSPTNTLLELQVVVDLVTMLGTIATILGTGLLALPVSLDRAGFIPFEIGYLFSAVFSIMSTVLLVELFERADRLLLEERLATGRTLAEGMRQCAYGGRALSQVPAVNASSNPLAMSSVSLMIHCADMDLREPYPMRGITPSLDDLGRLFLPKWLRVLYVAAWLGSLVIFLVSYMLAGSQAFVELATGSVTESPGGAVVFGLVLTAMMFVFGPVLIPVMSFATMVKSTMLVVLVLLTGVVAVRVAQPLFADYTAVLEPVSLELVALSGVESSIPFLWARIRHRFTSRPAIVHFLLSVCAGILLVWVVSSLWVFFVLRTVPATGPGPSLEQARRDGLISTVPLTAFIRESYPSLAWIAIIVQLFILIAISVSFVALGLGLKDLASGLGRDMYRVVVLGIRHTHAKVSTRTHSVLPSTSLGGGEEGSSRTGPQKVSGSETPDSQDSLGSETLDAQNSPSGQHGAWQSGGEPGDLRASVLLPSAHDSRPQTRSGGGDQLSHATERQSTIPDRSAVRRRETGEAGVPSIAEIAVSVYGSTSTSIRVLELERISGVRGVVDRGMVRLAWLQNAYQVKRNQLFSACVPHLRTAEPTTTPEAFGSLMVGLAFMATFIIAVSYPQGFIFFVSIAGGIISAFLSFFIPAYMLWTARTRKSDLLDLQIPMLVPKWALWLVPGMLIYGALVMYVDTIGQYV